MADKLLIEHNQSIMRWKRTDGFGSPPCSVCKSETETWWSYCAMCGHHIAAGVDSSSVTTEEKR